MASNQEDDDFFGFSDDEGDGINSDSDSEDDGNAADLVQVAEGVQHAHEYGEFEQFESVPDLNEEVQQVSDEGGVGQQQNDTTVGTNIQEVPFLFYLNMLPPEENASFQHHQTTTRTPNHHKPKTPRINNELRLEILLFLLNRQIPGLDTLLYGTVRDAMVHFGYTRKTIGKLWNRAKRQKQAMDSYILERKYHNCGRKNIQVTYDSIASIGMGDRTCLRDLAKMLNLGATTVWRLVKRKMIKPHSSPLYPDISEECKMARMRWVLRLIMDYTIPQEPTYYNMYDFIHIDEKWFYLTQKKKRVYFANNEPYPHKSAKSRTKVPKFMFMAAVARPRWAQDRQCKFDSKIGIFPFTDSVAAKRSPKNRVKGTIETEPVKSFNQIETKGMLINTLIPPIKEKWPPHEGENVIFIIQDNPTNSPDCNILDLGFFRSIQSLMHKKMPKTMEDLTGAVTGSFNELHPKTLFNVWMTLQFVANEILKPKGNNDYQLPHNKKKI
ncbi:uncharacterized protein [Spinacia oleracea]|uniref:Uncharacterized protein n=1 Tax=Spinacia oleracea TaxID=3562 RepID=A0A9R0J055_SPIOL|nr:uncharacterized protein LOC110798060 [Spinacia oleracea]